MDNRDLQFTHKALVQVKVAGVAVSLYPVLGNTTSSAERAHAFHVNKSNLMATHLTPRQILNAQRHGPTDRTKRCRRRG